MSIFAVPNKREINNRGVAQLASASGLGPEGPVFESQYPDKRVVDFQLLFFLSNFDASFLNFAFPVHENVHFYGRQDVF